MLQAVGRGGVFMLITASIAYMTHRAWFQYGLEGPSFAELTPGTFFIHPWMAGFLLVLLPGAVAGYAVAGWQFVVKGTRIWLARYLGASALIVAVVVGIGSQVVISVV